MPASGWHPTPECPHVPPVRQIPCQQRDSARWDATRAVTSVDLITRAGSAKQFNGVKNLTSLRELFALVHV
ncbi:hypothetical protein SAMN05444858_110172 [Micromonospora avicenniae]|uniref:Uncharacterized protein n=1 Tax=Micromonospora avicenniae TaxID=1198245 RepID=A0A1N7B853_9ACTN|nr:hypothetical protein SAMN05444858_110172 [Micromonospora avicenniae]